MGGPGIMLFSFSSPNADRAEEAEMSELRDRVVFITGASSGIGRSCGRAFGREGAKILMAARRADRLAALAAELRTDFGTAVHFFGLDVRRAAEVEKAITALPAEWQAIDILVNNAGLSRGLDKLHEGVVGDWEEMIDTNVKGLLYVSRAVIPGMISRGRGHVINLGSVAGHEVYPGGNVYCATKAAVNALTRALRLDLVGTPLRVTSVDPGMVETEFSLVRFRGDAARAAKVYQGLQPLRPDDIAEVIVFCASRPAHVNINEVIVMPQAQASATVVHRQG
jgi:serine 3-dehydrogenase